MQSSNCCAPIVQEGEKSPLTSASQPSPTSPAISTTTAPPAPSTTSTGANIGVAPTQDNYNFRRANCGRTLFTSAGSDFRRASLVASPASRHRVPPDSADSPVLRAAIAVGANLLVTDDAHLLAMNPRE